MIRPHLSRIRELFAKLEIGFDWMEANDDKPEECQSLMERSKPIIEELKALRVPESVSLDLLINGKRYAGHCDKCGGTDFRQRLDGNFKCTSCEPWIRKLVIGSHTHQLIQKVDQFDKLRWHECSICKFSEECNCSEEEFWKKLREQEKDQEYSDVNS